MPAVTLKSLVGTLNETCRRALETAAGLCLSRTHYDVEIEHWLLKLIEVPNGDLANLFRFYEIDQSRLQRDLTRSIDRLKTGNGRSPVFSPHLISLTREAALIGWVEYHSKTRSGHLLLAILSDESWARSVLETSDEFRKLSADNLKKDLATIVAQSSEEEQSSSPGDSRGSGQSSSNAPRSGAGNTPSLDQFTVDLTEKAKAGKIDPVLGRDQEIRLVIDILTKARKNNPILTGEAGVGKTAVVEGFAQRVAAGDVPPVLQNVSIRVLDLGLLQAGAGVKGEFENRLKGVISEVQASAKPIILFIDEAHTLIGAGGTAGQNDAANLLKPALARGELRTIAATTWAEYKKYFEEDPALARRFEVIKVDEPSIPVAVEMMRGFVKTLEAHHGVRVMDEAVYEAVRLSARYISGRQLPDKSVGLLDTACSRVSIGTTTTPPAVEDCIRRIAAITNAVEVLDRETVTGSHHAEKLAEFAAEKAIAETRLKTLQDRWRQELNLVTTIRTTRAKLEGPIPTRNKPVPGALGGEAFVTPTYEQQKILRSELDRSAVQLKTLQGESPLVQVCVDAQTVADVVQSWTGIPVGRMVANEIKTILTLKDRLEERIIGQGHALRAIANAIQPSRANLADPRTPIGVFLMVGSSGVGKTETALALAELLYGGEENLTVFNMSEYKEEHKASQLVGTSAGYVGYGKGGILTEAVRRKPYSVILLDEMEKAHPSIYELFYQVFDKGMMKDGEGREVNFKNTLIIMTSNAGTEIIIKQHELDDTPVAPQQLEELLRPELLKVFKDAFVGRCTVVPYLPLAPDVLRRIIELKLKGLNKRIQQNYRAGFSYDPAVVDHISARCSEVRTGGRNIDRIMRGTLLPELAGEFLSRMAEDKPVTSVRVGVGDSGFTYAVV